MLKRILTNFLPLRKLSLVIYIGIFVGSVFLNTFTYPLNSTPFVDFSFEPWLITGLSRDLYSSLFDNPFSFLIQICLTISSYGLLVFVFSRHINFAWSVALGLVAMCYIENYPLRDFVFNILWFEIPVFSRDYWLAGMNQPVPLISNFLFLVFAALCYKYRFKQIGLEQVVVLTLFPILISGLSGIDGFLSLVFGLGFFAARIFRSAGVGRPRLWSFALLAVFTFSTVVIIFLDFNKLITVSTDQYMLSLYKIISIFGIPIAGCVFICWLGQLDFKECWVNFSSLILVMLFEVVLIIGSTIGLINFDVARLDQRAFQGFFHVAYYIPMIYFGERFLTNISFLKGRLPGLLNWHAACRLLLYVYRIFPHGIALICSGYLVFTTRFFG